MATKTIPTTFEAIPQCDYEQITPLISKGKVSIFYKGKNRNGGFITDEFAEKLISNLPYVPVVGIYDKEKDDFTSHNRDRDVARMYGLVPENPNGEWLTKMDEDGVEREYFVSDVYLYTGRFTNAQKIIGNPQSLELDINSIKGNWVLMDDGREYFVYTDANFIGLSALGKDVKPCFEGAAFFDLVTQFGEFLSQAELTNNKNKDFDKGGKEMNLVDFKFSNDETKDKIWKAVNPNFSEEGNWKIDKVVCEIASDYVLVNYVEESKYERYAYVLKEDGTVELVGEPEIVYNTWIKQEDVKNYEALSSDYSSCEEILNKFSALNETISEKDTKILELDNDKSTYELEVNAVKEDLEKVQNDYNLLKQDYDNKVTSEKEAKISEYSNNISEDALKDIREKMASYSLEQLEKELLFAMKKEKPSMFSQTTSTQYAYSAMVGDSDSNGIVSILQKYRKN